MLSGTFDRLYLFTHLLNKYLFSMCGMPCITLDGLNVSMNKQTKISSTVELPLY